MANSWKFVFKKMLMFWIRKIVVVQKRSFCNAKAVELRCKTIGITTQNDRNCNAKRPLLQCCSLLLLAHIVSCAP